MWFRKPKLKNSELGTLTFSNGRWLSTLISTYAGEVLIALEGDATSPALVALENAKVVLSDIHSFVRPAIDFATSETRVREFVEGNGDFVLDGITSHAASGSVDIELTLSEWPDAMITVVFNEWVACQVHLAD